MFDSGGPVRMNQEPPAAQRVQQGQKAGIRLTGSSEVFWPMKSIRLQKLSEVVK